MVVGKIHKINSLTQSWILFHTVILSEIIFLIENLLNLVNILKHMKASTWIDDWEWTIFFRVRFTSTQKFVYTHITYEVCSYKYFCKMYKQYPLLNRVNMLPPKYHIFMFYGSSHTLVKYRPIPLSGMNLEWSS